MRRWKASHPIHPQTPPETPPQTPPQLTHRLIDKLTKTPNQAYLPAAGTISNLVPASASSRLVKAPSDSATK